MRSLPRTPVFWRIASRVGVLLQKNGLYCKLHYRRAIQRTKEMSDSPPTNLYVETTNTCNARCIMCPYPQMRRPKGVMVMDTFKRIVDEAASCGIKKVGLSFMGEPFLEKTIFNRIMYVKEKGLQTVFNTNASLLSEDKVKLLIESEADEIIVSIDAFKKETYEKIRIGLDFERVVANIRQLMTSRKKMNAKHPLVTLAYIVLRENRGEEGLFYNYWRDKVDNIMITFPRDWAGQKNVLSNSGVHIRRDLPIKNPCDNLWKDLVILHDGNVVLCCNDYDGKVIMGNILKQGIMGVWNGETFRYYREMHMNDRRDELPLCNQCSKYSVWW